MHNIDEAMAALAQVRTLQRACIRQHVADNFCQEHMVGHYIFDVAEVARDFARSGTAGCGATLARRNS